MGSLAGGVSGVVKAVNQAKAARQKLEEAERHNKTMEAIAIGNNNNNNRTGGSGLYLKPYKKGLGLYLGKNVLNKKNCQ